MAKYTINHTCGHDQVHQLFGPSKDRDRKREWLATTPCTACYQAQLAAQREAENAAAAQAAAEQGLPALIGTPKQIAWAESIRVAALATIDAAQEALIKRLDAVPWLSEAARAEVRNAAAKVVADLRGRTDAAAWIDERDEPHDATWIGRQIKARGLAPTYEAELLAQRQQQGR